MDPVSYSIASIIQSYDSREGINVMEKDDIVYVDFTLEFPTPGYIVNVERVIRSDAQYKVYFKIQAPAPDRVLPQIITYKTLTMKIPKKELASPPYKFQAVEMKMA